MEPRTWAYARAIVTAFVSPITLMRWLRDHHAPRSIVPVVVVGSLAWACLARVAGAAAASLTAAPGMGLDLTSYGLASVAILLVVPLVALALVCLVATYLYLGARILGGTAGFAASFAIAVYASAPLAAVALVTVTAALAAPHLDATAYRAFVAGFLWPAAIAAVGLREVHVLSWARATGAVALPVAVVLLALVIGPQS